MSARPGRHGGGAGGLHRLARLVVLAVVLLVTALVVPPSSVRHSDAALVDVGTGKAVGHTSRVVWVLCLGSDARPGQGLLSERADAIQLVGLNLDTGAGTMIGIPRDSYVEIPGHGRNKINAAFELGGPALTVKTLEDLTGAHMDHVVLVNFDGFVDLTTDLGGVTVPNKTTFSSHGYDYPKGKVTIEGKKALWFVRERHSLPGGDLDRAENQRNVIKAIVSKGLSPAVISDPAKFTSFIGNLSKHLTVDNSLSDSEIRSTALSLRLDGSDIELLQAPLAGFGTANGQSIDVVDTARMAELGKALRDDEMGSYLAKYPQG